MKKYTLISILLLVAMIMISLPIYADNNEENIKAKIINDNGIVEENIEETETIKKVQNIVIKILNGEYESEEYEMQYILSDDINSSVTSRRALEEKDIIWIDIEQADGEITNIFYKGMFMQNNNSLYIIAGICFILILIIGRKKVIGQMISHLLIICFVCFIFIISIKKQWNLIISSIILSFIITTIISLNANKLIKEVILSIICSMLIICFTGIIAYILFDIINLVDPMLNINIDNIIINIKDLLCAFVILLSCGIYNSMTNANIIYSIINKEKDNYKTKSDNIIEGQRSLKL